MIKKIIILIALTLPFTLFGKYFIVFDKNDEFKGTIFTKAVASAQSGNYYKSTVIKIKGFRTIFNHQVYEPGFKFLRFKSRPPSIGSKSFILFVNDGGRIKIIRSNGKARKVKSFGSAKNFIVIDSHDPTDLKNLLRFKDGLANLRIYDLFLKKTVQVEVGSVEESEIDIFGSTHKVKKVDIKIDGKTTTLFFDEKNALIGFETDNYKGFVKNLVPKEKIPKKLRKKLKIK